jgi:hypothetical protein
MTQHTPARWIVGAPRRPTKTSDPVFDIAMGDEDEATVTGPQAADNARLIAAAPAMYEALMQIANFDPTRLDAATLGNIARSAIARATR